MPAALPAPSATALTPVERAEFERSGYLRLAGRFAFGEVEAWRAECDRLLGLSDRIHPDNLRVEMAGGRVWKFDPLVDISPVFAALARDPRITAPLASLYGGRAPMLFKDKLIYKPPGSHGNGLHQDWNWWQGFPTSLITVTIAIDGGTRENGCTEVFAGHDRGFLTAPGRLEYLTPEVVDLDSVRHFESEPGDFALFHCFTPHRAGENRSSAARRQLFLTYGDSADGDLYQAHYRHMWDYRKATIDEAARARAHFR
jgi:hypothetical protein